MPGSWRNDNNENFLTPAAMNSEKAPHNGNGNKELFGRFLHQRREDSMAKSS
jgi:hypothetical protein